MNTHNSDALSPVVVDADVVMSDGQKSSPKPWLLWTGVLGAGLALLSLLASLLLGQRMNEVQQQYAGMAETVTGLQEQREQVETLQQHIQQLLQAQRTLEAQQQATDQQQQTHTQQLAVLVRHKASSWQLTDIAAVRLMLAELKSVTLTSSDARVWLAFLIDWQSWLLQSGVADDHALVQALRAEQAAIRVDWPSWQTEAQHWQQLSSVLAGAIPKHASVSQSPLVTEGSDDSWWHMLGNIIRITPATLDDQAMSQQVRERNLWPVQTALAMETLRAGMVLAQADVVQASANTLAQLLAQHAPDVWQQWQPHVSAWQTWQPIPKPQWQHIQRYMESQQGSAS